MVLRSGSSLSVLVLVSLHIQWAVSVYDPAKKIESARLYGNVDSYAYYYVDLLVGTPTPQLTSVIVDTGSTIAGFPCASCGHCGNHIDPPFHFTQSKTASWMGCSADCTGGCPNGKCSYSQTYTEGSSISGSWFQDKVQLGDIAQSNPPVLAQLGCHSDENKLFYTQRANGILGLAPYRGGRPTILRDLFSDTTHVNNNIFSMCLAVWGGRLTVGGYNVSYHSPQMAIQWIPLTLGRYYTVTLDSISIGGQTPQEPVQLIASGQETFGQAMVDSGTTYSYFPDDIFNKLDAAVHAYCVAHASCGAVPTGPCWELNNVGAGPVLFPILSFTFGGVKVNWHPTAYLYQRSSTNKWCKAYASNGLVASTVLGATWMIGKEVIFDAQNKQLGIIEANCPEYRQGSGPLAPLAKKFLDTGAVATPASNVGQVGLLCLFSAFMLVALAAGVVRRGRADVITPDTQDESDLDAEE